ncbi:TolC family protein [Uliginosibacterium paludis]|uniref:TolC family protein n=1 Tax=Uliginosibacterium paludis TaxID=1615952 RepID=A0ABV2CT50_9RHOO
MPASLKSLSPSALPLALMLGALLLGGCAITPKPLTDDEVRARVNADQFKLYTEQEPIFKPVSFDEAVARALKYNLDYRLKLMESALSAGLADVSRYDMLPNLLASAGYHTRSNDSGGTSVSLGTGQVSLEPSTSQERQRVAAGIEFSWNVLDFGVSYYRARQQSNQYLIAEERRRRVIQNILQDVRSAYWRAVGAQRLARETQRLTLRTRDALARSREAEAQGLLSPRDALNYQRVLLDAGQLLSARRQELELARRELAALMNVPPGSEFSLVESEEPGLRPVPFNVAELEELALQNRPELREEDYRVRVTADEARRQLLALLPGLSLSTGLQYDSNKYLYNNNWVESALRVNFNLFKLLAAPATHRLLDSQQKADEARRFALSMAVLTQVRVAIERYRTALSDLEVARDSSVVDQRLLGFARATVSSRTDSELEVVRAEVRALNSEYQRNAAYASAQAAFGRIYNAIGLEVVPEDLSSSSLQEVAQTVTRHVAMVEGDVFPSPRTVPVAQRALVLQIDTRADPAISADQQAGLRAAIVAALARNGIRITEAAGSTGEPRLTMRFLPEPVRDGVRRVKWALDFEQTGLPAQHLEHASSLPAAGNAGVMTAFAEAAALANLRQLESWLSGSAQ